MSYTCIWYGHSVHVCAHHKHHLLIALQRQAKGVQLLDETFKRLDLVEKDYFGLLYTDNDTGLMVCTLYIVQLL